MVKIAVLGDTESIKGFAAVGLDIYPCDRDNDSPEEFKKIVSAGYGVIFVTERLVPFLEKEIEILIDLKDGEYSATAWGCDLTYDYVRINGDYRS